METTAKSNSSDNRGRPANSVVEARQLLSSGNEIRIRHDGQEYRLRLTKNNKLILTK